VLVLMPVSLFAAEAAALHALSLDRPGNASLYWTVGGLVIAGISVLLPFVLEGLQRMFLRNERAFGEKMRLFFLLTAIALATYCAIGLLVLVL
jgi:hypothetical protein